VRFGIAPASYDELATGIEVGGVTPGQPAEAAGIRKGDVITHWNGEEMGGMGGLMQRLSTHEPGDVVRITVERDGQPMDFTVTLTAREGES
jgi:S1-C subfamily serine protease